MPWRLWEESCIVRIDRVRLTIETEVRRCEQVWVAIQFQRVMNPFAPQFLFYQFFAPQARTQSYAESQHGGKASNGGSAAAAAGNPPWSKTDDGMTLFCMYLSLA